MLTAPSATEALSARLGETLESALSRFASCGQWQCRVDNPLQKWGLAVAACRGRNKAAVAVARKLTAAIWHVLQGHAIGALERVDRLYLKLFKLATEVGLSPIKAQGYESKEAFIQKKLYVLRSYP